MTDGVPEQVKTFVFHSNPNINASGEFESLEVLIPEVNTLVRQFCCQLECIACFRDSGRNA